VTRSAAITTAAVALSAVAAAAPAHAAAAPRIQQLVVFKNGDAKQRSVVAKGTSVKVGKKRCAVGAGTPLAALLRSKPGGIRLKDYGACSRKPADAAGLYVARIRKDSARGPNGWVYKVGNRVAPAGAADPTGPFGNGRLKPKARVTWFYCFMKANGCQRTLAISKVETPGGGQVRVTVRAYDDRGKGRAARNATVHAGGATAKTDSKGVATLTAAPGRRNARAEGKGVVRSFGEQIEVK
jgi:hypothetical protein